MSRSKQKGTAAETAVARYLQTNGWAHCERRALIGSSDKGDITGVPGICVEVKSAVRYDIPEWLKETATETGNARADHGVLIVKPKGVGDTRVGDWWAVMPLAHMVRLLHAAGYGDAPASDEFDGDPA